MKLMGEACIRRCYYTFRSWWLGPPKPPIVVVAELPGPPIMVVVPFNPPIRKIDKTRAKIDLDPLDPYVAILAQATLVRNWFI